MLHVSGLLESLRGQAQGTTADAQPALFHAITPCLQPLLQLQKVYHQHEAIVCLLLKLAGDVVEAHVSYLLVSSGPAILFYSVNICFSTWCVDVIEGTA